MPAKPRSAVFEADEVGVYHCWNRLVRRRRLFGRDDVTGDDYSYRKAWVKEQFKLLAGSMAIDVLDYAVLDNHLHVVLRNRPDIVASWSDEEVTHRWWFVCPMRKNRDGTIPDPLPCEIGILMTNVAEYRQRLSDISWFMRLSCQRIARRANSEDAMDGRFFAKRFGCDRLESEVDVLNCSLYVDLNWVHAGMAETPEDSVFTSVYDRIQARWDVVGRQTSDPQGRADDWLAPVFLDARSEAYVGPCTSTDEETHSDRRFSNPIGASRVSNKGFLSISVQQYLKLIDSLGRVIRHDKRGSIPTHLPPILNRLGLEPQTWFDSFLEFVISARN